MKSTCTTRINAHLLALALGFALSAGVPRASAQDNLQPSLQSTNSQLAEDPTVGKATAETSATNIGARDVGALVQVIQDTARTGRQSRGGQRDAVVSFGRDVELKEGETAEAVVVIGGNAVIKGKVRAAAVAIGGDLDISGDVGEAVVSVLGSVKLGPGAKVHGDVVSVGGTVNKAEGAEVRGQIQEVGINFGGLGLPKLDWLKSWLVQCVFKCRPLAPQVGWVWVVAGGFLLLYLLIALAFPGAIQACVNRLNEQPATTFLTGLLTKLLVPFVLGLLLITGIGIIGIPFLVAAVVLAKLFGKVALFIYLGQQLGRAFKASALQKTLVAFLIGWILVTLLYIVPFLGLFTLIVLDIWALGVAVMAIFSRSRREAPPKPAVALAPAFAPAAPPAQAFNVAAPVVGEGVAFTATPIGLAGASTVPGPMPVPPAIPPAGQVGLPDAFTYPRATFWLRMGAGFLDLVLVMILSRFIPFLHDGFAFLIVSVAYFAGMWAWKGTTVGGIVTNLKVARTDGQPVTFAVALVRALAGWFSAVVLFLGFFWIAWDREQQGWHDKIAGTAVVRLPRGMPLLL